MRTFSQKWVTNMCCPIWVFCCFSVDDRQKRIKMKTLCFQMKMQQCGWGLNWVQKLRRRQKNFSAFFHRTNYISHSPPIFTKAALCTLGAQPFQSPRTPCLRTMVEKACTVFRTLRQ